MRSADEGPGLRAGTRERDGHTSGRQASQESKRATAVGESSTEALRGSPYLPQEGRVSCRTQETSLEAWTEALCPV